MHDKSVVVVLNSWEKIGCKNSSYFFFYLVHFDLQRYTSGVKNGD